MGNKITPPKKKDAVKLNICSSRKELWERIKQETNIVIDWGQVYGIGYFYLTSSDCGITEVSPNEEGSQPFKTH